MVVLVNLSGRGDKDVDSVLEWDAGHADPPAEASEGLLQPVPHGARQPLDEPASTRLALHRRGKR